MLITKTSSDIAKSSQFLFAVLGLSIAIFMSNLDIAMINIALPQISRELNFAASIFSR